MNKHEIKATLNQLNTIPLPDKKKILIHCMDCQDKGTNIPYVKRNRLRPLIAAAITLVLLISSFSTYAIAKEAKEYKAAITFFQANELSTDGLSRGDIKRVYRDITTGSFSYDKTAKVIQGSIKGYEISQGEPTPEDLENLWNYRNSNGRYMIGNIGKRDGVSYKYYSQNKYSESLGFQIHDKSIVEKYMDDKIAWSAEFKDFYIDGYTQAGDKIIVYGQSPTWSSTQKSYAYMAMIDSHGTVLWQTMLDNRFGEEYITSVLPDTSGIAVFSRGDSKYLCLSEYTMDGKALSFHKTEVGNYAIWNAARFGDGYIVQLGNFTQNEHERIIKVAKDGSITDSFTYTSENEQYFITDMKEYNGCIYLSAYSIPSSKDANGRTGGHYDVESILNYIFKNEYYNISNEELTKLVRDNFTAVLLVCEPSSGTPQEFFSVKGSLGSKLSISDNGNLLWDVESISDTYLSLATSSFSIGGASYVYRYSFDANGTILSQEKTGEVVDFRR